MDLLHQVDPNVLNVMQQEFLYWLVMTLKLVQGWLLTSLVKSGTYLDNENMPLL